MSLKMQVRTLTATALASGLLFAAACSTNRPAPDSNTSSGSVNPAVGGFNGNTPSMGSMGSDAAGAAGQAGSLDQSGIGAAGGPGSTTGTDSTSTTGTASGLGNSGNYPGSSPGDTWQPGQAGESGQPSMLASPRPEYHLDTGNGGTGGSMGGTSTDSDLSSGHQ